MLVADTFLEDPVNRFIDLANDWVIAFESILGIGFMFQAILATFCLITTDFGEWDEAIALSFGAIELCLYYAIKTHLKSVAEPPYDHSKPHL
jgi:hypothetical protein